jgi:tetratricopeptide (TPR) repeat protein
VLLDYPWYQARLKELNPGLEVPPGPQGSPAGDMAWMVAHNPKRPAVWTNTYTKGWTDEAHLLHRGLVLRRQAKARPFDAKTLLAERVWPAYARRGAFAPGERPMDALSVRLVRDNYVEAQARLAQALVDAKAWGPARAEYRALGILRPHWSPPWLQAGNSAWFAGDVSGAETDWTRAQQEDEKSAEAYANLGLVAFQQKRYDQAASLARKALALDAKLANAQQLLAQAMQAQVAPGGAPNLKRGEAAALRADQLAAKQQWAGALNAYDEAMREGYVNVAVLRNRGVMLGYLGRNKEAAEALAQAKAAAPQNADLVKLHGYFLFNGGQQEAGLAELEAALKLAPQDAEIQQLVANAKKALHR